MENFGYKIKELRKNAGISQKELAGRIGITPPNLSQWEGMAIPPLEGIMKVCHELGIPLWSFFSDGSGDRGHDMPSWMKPEYMAFIQHLSNLPEEVQKQLLEHFTGIISMRKML